MKITDYSLVKIEIIVKKCWKSSAMHFGGFKYAGYHLGHENLHPTPVGEFNLSY